MRNVQRGPIRTLADFKGANIGETTAGNGSETATNAELAGAVASRPDLLRRYARAVVKALILVRVIAYANDFDKKAFIAEVKTWH